MPGLLIIAGVVGLLAATAALWLQARRRIGPRGFAVLIAIAVSSSLFSACAWAVTLLTGIASVPVAWAFIGVLSVVFARRLYRELNPSAGRSG